MPYAITTINKYHVMGNEHIAIAINVDDPTDAHSFTPQFEMGAYERAVAWTSWGI